MLALGGLELGNGVPRIAAAISDREIAEHADVVRRYADLVELRIDRFVDHDAVAVEAACRAARALGRPLLATVRAAAEGGAADLADPVREALFATVLPLVDGVDVELAAPICKPVLALARRQGKLGIASHHDFAATPPAAELVRIADGALAVGADVVKIATHASGIADVERLLAVLLERRQRQGTIVIAMGPHGVASRVFFPLLGSLLTYGYTASEGAPGQLSLAELDAELRRYSPAYVAAKAGQQR